MGLFVRISLWKVEANLDLTLIVIAIYKGKFRVNFFTKSGNGGKLILTERLEGRD